MKLHYEILDEQRQALLPQFTGFKEEGFYLAGGTALALVLGHRDSIDFDFFNIEPFDTSALFARLQRVFEGHTLLKTQEETDTLSVLIDDNVRVSFFSYPYPLIQPLIESEYFQLASVEDIACMKLSAVTGRTAFKDYVDLYFILAIVSLKDILAALQKKMPQLDPLLVQKSLIYFDDLHEESILFKTKPVSMVEIKTRLTDLVKEYPSLR